jgi:hypothetical protein
MMIFPNNAFMMKGRIDEVSRMPRNGRPRPPKGLEESMAENIKLEIVTPEKSVVNEEPNRHGAGNAR